MRPERDVCKLFQLPTFPLLIIKPQFHLQSLKNAQLISTVVKMSDSSDSEDEMVPGLVMANGKDLDLDDEDEGEEMYVDSLGQALDLFSPKTFPTAEECMEHCR